MLYGTIFVATAALLVAFGLGDEVRKGIVHLFEWRFDDIANECEQFLGPKGFAGIQVSPVNEYAVITSPSRPWWERYQPFSYTIVSRSGNETEFQDMCSRCNNVGVKVYVDVTLNDMSASWSNGTTGTGGSTPDTSNKSYPEVPYTSEHFHSTCSISDYTNETEVRVCELSGLHDLDQSQEYVRGKMVDYLDKLVDLGASGFRVDAAKHMYPDDLKNITDRVKNLPSGERPFVYQEVASGGAVTASEYFDIGLVTEFKFGSELSRCFQGNNALKWLTNFGEPWSLMTESKALVFIDNHDTQRSDSDILNYKTPKAYKSAIGFMFAWNYGVPRIISSFNFSSSDQGPPSNSDESIQNVVFNSDGLGCSNGWVCEHRWRPIFAMVNFARIVNGTSITNFTDNDSNQISFCRGNKGFAAFNVDSYDMNSTAQTCLPAGTYCDIVTGEALNGQCTGKSIVVGSDGTALISILESDSEGFLAIHVESNVDYVASTSPTAATATIATAAATAEATAAPISSAVAKEIIVEYDREYNEFRTFLCKKLNLTTC